MPLPWHKLAASYGLEAETEIGSYTALDIRKLGYSGYSAFFRPPWVRLPKDQQLLANSR